MRVGKEMILTVLVVAVALGAESELKIRIICLRPSADSTLMPGDTAVRNYP